MKYVLYDANIEFNAEKRALMLNAMGDIKCTHTHTHTSIQTLIVCSVQRLCKSVDAKTHTNGQTTTTTNEQREYESITKKTHTERPPSFAKIIHSKTEKRECSVQFVRCFLC